MKGATAEAAPFVVWPRELVAILEVQEIDEERGGERQRAQPRVHRGAELHPERVGVGEGLAQEAAPLLGDAPHLLLALQRNLQILGAFAFLSQMRGKPFFARYLRPALDSLATQLASPAAAGFPALRHLTDQCRLEFERRS